ncbi:MAG TPA: hypothetical protein VK457_12585 [Chloroflexota bacterium]|jgi:hypothetical protein|nr:hypothetical protein [Chloroflexota bacterium]
MAQGKIDKLRDIAHRFRVGELSLRDAALEAGMTEDQFTKAVKSYAWMEDKAGAATKIAGGAAQATRRLWTRWTKG